MQRTRVASAWSGSGASDGRAFMQSSTNILAARREEAPFGPIVATRHHARQRGKTHRADVVLGNRREQRFVYG